MNKDSYLSPSWLLETFDNWFDPCPAIDNPEVDALKIEWKDKTYVNPPYSNPLPFVEKAIEESKKGKRIVMLLKVDSSTKWFAKLIEAKAHILWLNGRIRYMKPEFTFNKNTPANFPSMLVILNTGGLD
jgi:phage N-6-adenine-methyltransferase